MHHNVGVLTLSQLEEKCGSIQFFTRVSAHETSIVDFAHLYLRITVHGSLMLIC